MNPLYIGILTLLGATYPYAKFIKTTLYASRTIGIWSKIGFSGLYFFCSLYALLYIDRIGFNRSGMLLFRPQPLVYAFVACVGVVLVIVYLGSKNRDGANTQTDGKTTESPVYGDPLVMPIPRQAKPLLTPLEAGKCIIIRMSIKRAITITRILVCGLCGYVMNVPLRNFLAQELYLAYLMGFVLSMCGPWVLFYCFDLKRRTAGFPATKFDLGDLMKYAFVGGLVSWVATFVFTFLFFFLKAHSQAN